MISLLLFDDDDGDDPFEHSWRSLGFFLARSSWLRFREAARAGHLLSTTQMAQVLRS